MPQSAGKKSGQATLLSFFQKTKEKPRSSPQSSPLTSGKRSWQLSNGNEKSSADPTPSAIDQGSGGLVTPMSQQAGSEPSTIASSSPGKRRRRNMVLDDSESEPDADSSSDADFAMAAAESDSSSDIEAEEVQTKSRAKPKTSLKSDTDVSGLESLEINTLASSPPPDLSAKNSRKSISSITRDALTKFNASSDYTASSSIESTSNKKKPTGATKRSDGTDGERYKWLLDIKDADGNRPDDPDYDPRTLFIPSSAWVKFTPFEKQYWEIKSKMWNTVVFFKKGKFYELYENDAEIAHSTFDLKLAGGGRANMSLCGVPEMSFDYWASAFIAKGHKVARVDQAETALGKEMRDQSTGKKEEKIIRRQLSCILTAGTLTDATMLVSDLSQYCMAIKQDETRFSVCFVDTATGAFFLSTFDDSPEYNQLETLIVQIRPREILLERGNMDRNAVKLIKNNVSVDTLWEILKPGDEFWDAEHTRYHISTSKFFGNEDPDDKSGYPAALLDCLDCELTMSTLGGLLWYLKLLKIDEQLVTMKQFQNYSAFRTSQGAMVLDGQTLTNLEVFTNTWDGGSDGTLFKLVNKCVTPFGKRRLRSWVAHPLQSPSEIAARADVVDMLLMQGDLREAIEAKLGGLPDAERMLSRVHAGLLKPRDFVKLIHGLERMDKFVKWLATQELGKEANLLSEIAKGIGETPIEQWMSAFDHGMAHSEDVIIPESGVEPEFDASIQTVRGIEAELQSVLKQYRKDFSSLALEFRDSGKEIYLVEVPVKLASKVPKDWQLMGATAKAKRYWSPEIRKLVRTLQEALETHKGISNGVQTRLYHRFSQDYYHWLDLVRAIAAIDCLLSLARASASMSVHCRPTILTDAEETFLDFHNLRHPCSSADFIPNDVQLGGPDAARISLLTGANAAGKSTVLRMTGCAVLLAQIGCHVPAETCQLTPVDRILTRLGASDNIFAGKSTFHVELSETQRILSEATSRSLVVLDELGRGGSSADGLAIAESVLHHLATRTGCVGYFATHYGTLVDVFKTHPKIKPQRMAVSVDRDSREVTFLYRLEPGQSEGSFGMNVAAMCGVSPVIVTAAEKAAAEFMGSAKNQLHEKSETIPLGLESDFVCALSHETPGPVVEVMLSMAMAL